MKKLISSLLLYLLLIISIPFCGENKKLQEELSEPEQKILIGKILGRWQDRKYPGRKLKISKEKGDGFTVRYLGGEYYLENSVAKCEKDFCTFANSKFPEDSWKFRPIHSGKTPELIILRAPMKDKKLSFPSTQEKLLIEPDSIFDPNDCPESYCD